MAKRRTPPTPAPNFSYDEGSRRWRDGAGKIVAKAAVPNVVRAARAVVKGDEQGPGFNVKLPSRTPASDSYSRVEEAVTGARALMASLDLSQRPPLDRKGNPIGNPDPIPSNIRASYMAAEMFLNAEGDIWQTVEAPIDIALAGGIEVSHADEGVQRDLRDLYSQSGIDLWGILNQIWLSLGTYGVAYPLEVPSQEKKGEVTAVTMLPPRFMWVGYYVSNQYGQAAPDSNYKIQPLNGAPYWSEELAKNSFMPMAYNAFDTRINEQIDREWGLGIDSRYLYPVRAKTQSWVRYPTPPIQRAFRQIGTRIIWEEMARGTIEGFRNALWLFLLDDHKDGKRATPREISALKAVVEGIAGDRTGQLVWGGNLNVKVVTPPTLDQMMAPETWTNFTLNIFRQLGISLRLSTGNVVAPGRPEGTTLEVDLDVWLRRMEYMRWELMRWEQGFRVRLASSRDKSLGEKVKDATVRFSKNVLEQGALIEKELKPMYAAGLLSPQTTLGRAGYDYGQQVREKKQAQADGGLFTPPASFAQTVRKPAGGGLVDEITSQTPSPGRPSNSDMRQIESLVTQASVLKLAAAEDDDIKQEQRDYTEAVAALFGQLLTGMTVAAFIGELKRTNTERLGKLTTMSFKKVVPDFGDLSAETQRFAAEYVNSYADNLGDDLEAARTAGQSLDTFAFRVGLYPAEGFKAAFYNGQRAGMKIRGARGWRRVLHPEATESGPCPLCRADAQVVHGIDEAFQVMHPNEACTQKNTYLQYVTDQAVPSMEIPVASGTGLWAEILKELGIAATFIQRRSWAQ